MQVSQKLTKITFSLCYTYEVYEDWLHILKISYN